MVKSMQIFINANLKVRLVVTMLQIVNTNNKTDWTLLKRMRKRSKIMAGKEDIGLISIGLIISKVEILIELKLFIRWLLFLIIPQKNRLHMRFNIRTKIEFICSNKENLLGIESLLTKKDIISFLLLILMLLKSEFIALKFQVKLNFQEL